MPVPGLSLDGKIIVVTGAGRGLGRTYALHYAACGARVVVNNRSAAAAESAVEEIRAAGGEAVANIADVSQPSGGRAAIQTALDAFGGLDVVVNNAGIVEEKPFEEAELEDYEKLWRIHLGGHVNVSKAAWPIFKRQRRGKIIMTCSGAGLFGLRNEATYAAAKGAIHGLMRTLALEGADHGILVNSVCPGGVTEMHEQAFPDPAVFRMMSETLPAALVPPTLLWLASDACTISGQQLSVWGGRVARIAIGSGTGYIDRAMTAGSVAAHWDEVASIEGLHEATDGIGDVAYWQPHILKPPVEADGPAKAT